MYPPVLITYATKYGATAGIAEKIGEIVRTHGHTVDVVPVDQVREPDRYGAIVLGSAVYIGQWRKEAVAFLERHEHLLATLPVWLFSSGPTGAGDPVQLVKGWTFPPDQQALADRIQPRDIALFHGAITMERLNLPERMIVRMVQAPLGDFRDWEQISAWATAIAVECQEYVNVVGC